MAKEHKPIPPKEKEVECTCTIVYNRHGWGCQCDEGCPSGPDGIEFCPLHKAAKDLLTMAKKYVYHLDEIDADVTEETAIINQAEGK